MVDRKLVGLALSQVIRQIHVWDVSLYFPHRYDDCYCLKQYFYFDKVDKDLSGPEGVRSKRAFLVFRPCKSQYQKGLLDIKKKLWLVK